MKLNKLYGVKGNVTPDYFDCKMLNDLTKELRDEVLDTISEMREIDRLIGMCRDIATRYRWSRKRALLCAQIKSTFREYRLNRHRARIAATAYLAALDKAAQRRFKVAA